MASSTVFAVADSIGSTVTPRVASTIARDAEHRVASLLELANRIRRHRRSPILRISDVKQALEIRELPPLIGYHSSYKSYDYLPIPETSLFGLYDRDVSLMTFSRSGCPPYPTDLTFNFHWLAGNGVQPRVPGNQSEVSAELNVGQELFGPPPPLEPPNQTVAVISSETAISQELMEFFGQGIREQGFGQHLADIAVSPVIQPLIPRYLRYVTSLLAGPGNRDLQRCLDIARAVFSNPNVNCDPFVQVFETIALTIAIAPRLMQTADDDSAIREAAADFLAVIITRCASQYPDLRQKTAEKLLMTLFSDGAALTSKYGAAMACYALGPDIVQKFVLPNILPLLGAVKTAAESEDGPTRLQAARLRSALERICSNSLAGDFTGGIRVRAVLDRETAEMHDALVEFFAYRPFVACGPVRESAR
jgi:hypothetical protein